MGWGEPHRMCHFTDRHTAVFIMVSKILLDVHTYSASEILYDNENHSIFIQENAFQKTHHYIAGTANYSKRYMQFHTLVKPIHSCISGYLCMKYLNMETNA